MALTEGLLELRCVETGIGERTGRAMALVVVARRRIKTLVRVRVGILISKRL
jgi:hypothetical protein